jgi:ABC-type uncharacterized transport system substrate-binding protein
MAYAVNYPDLYSRAARLIGKIFKGAKPAHLPIEQPANFDLVIKPEDREVAWLHRLAVAAGAG